ncbi:acetolactate synthase small subunit [Buchnera aphidicola (Taiwanaphis decaspermi)]|uniref:acetolactate synthase small subunit n=1 Tax=Buchnera aphidicola TaxID=9 RepID=UPI0031B83AA9
MLKTLSIILENESGALSRVVGLFSQRGYNIESLTVSPTEDPTLSSMTIQTIGDNNTLEQIKKQLHKLIDVLQVRELNFLDYITKEIILLKIKLKKHKKKEIEKNIKKFKGKIINIKLNKYIIQLTDNNKRINSFIKIIKEDSNIIETSRSGIVVIHKN